jgi:putative hydrolase
MAMLGAMFGPGVQGMMSQLGAMFGGGLPWDMTRQIAAWSASGGATEPNVDPVDRIRLEELLRIALPHVEELAEVPVAGAGGLALDAVTRAGWAGDLLDRQRPLLERLAGSLGSAPAAPPGPDAPGAIPDPLSGLLRMLGPSLVAMQVGGMIGQLATRALSGYELPLPRTGPALERIVVVAAGVDEMAETWGLARDDVRLRVILGELAHTAVMRSPSVGAALADALARHASGFRLDPDAIGTLLADVDPTDPASIQAALSAPHRMLGAMTTPEQTAARADLDRLLAVLVGWVDHVVGQCAIRLLGSDRVGEALRRRRLEPSASDPMLDQLLGIRRDRAIVDRGAAFVRGIVERDPDRLPDLLRRAAAVPTAAELDAPGLWLARLELG